MKLAIARDLSIGGRSPNKTAALLTEPIDSGIVGKQVVIRLLPRPGRCPGTGQLNEAR